MTSLNQHDGILRIGMPPDFEGFKKIPRLNRQCVITEKIDGTNAQIFISDDGLLFAGSRNRWITPDNDNAGFARWVFENSEELMQLGPGTHYGEWWGCGIQRGYGLQQLPGGKPDRRFSLFNTARWSDDAVRPKCCGVVPVLYRGNFEEAVGQITGILRFLQENGSVAAPGFKNPEGFVVYHEAAGVLFKKTLENDGAPKGKVLQ